MFSESGSFNQDIGAWNVSNVKDMSRMFGSAIAFNQDIGAWDVSNVEDMSGMFAEAYRFNQDVGRWNVGNVKTMRLLFEYAESFNQDIGGWDVSNVIDMNGMFADTNSFNQDVGGWDVGNVKDMVGYCLWRGYHVCDCASLNWKVCQGSMFLRASNFRQNLCRWVPILSEDVTCGDMLLATSCPHRSDPCLGASFDHFCETC
mmetsp:Transcript_26904/g.62497  ORF Transcript_26904/g.62497 Transcript_26904/m.62497 type:complete len:202 (+) Transcript_26904:643-1248(+)